jgi:hypothetical protein
VTALCPLFTESRLFHCPFALYNMDCTFSRRNNKRRTSNRLYCRLALEVCLSVAWHAARQVYQCVSFLSYLNCSPWIYPLCRPSMIPYSSRAVHASKGPASPLTSVVKNKLYLILGTRSLFNNFLLIAHDRKTAQVDRLGEVIKLLFSDELDGLNISTAWHDPRTFRFK